MIEVQHVRLVITTHKSAIQRARRKPGSLFQRKKKFFSTTYTIKLIIAVNATLATIRLRRVLADEEKGKLGI
jgi:hypothetical protein